MGQEDVTLKLKKDASGNRLYRRVRTAGNVKYLKCSDISGEDLAKLTGYIFHIHRLSIFPERVLSIQTTRPYYMCYIMFHSIGS